MLRRLALTLAMTVPVGCGPAKAPPSNSDFKVPTLPAGRQNDGLAKPEKK